MSAARVHVVGASGSGTSTLGRGLAQHLGYEFLDADDFFWLPTSPPYTAKRPPDERLRLMLDAVESRTRSVVAGSVAGWGARLEDSFDLIIFLTVPTDIRLARLRVREQEKLGHVDEAFIEWAALYDSGRRDMRTRVVHEEWLLRRAAPVLRIDGPVELEESLRMAQEAIASV